MRKRLSFGVLLAALIGVALIGAYHEAAGGTTEKDVAFRGSYRGRLDILLRPTGFQLVSYGSGRATALGESFLLGTGPTSNPRPGCWRYEGLAQLVSRSGARLYLEFARQTGCVTSGTTFRQSGRIARVIGGTGAFARAKGRLTMTSSGDSVTGAITFTLSGSITY
jgi:hypothetical protein